MSAAMRSGARSFGAAALSQRSKAAAGALTRPASSQAAAGDLLLRSAPSPAAAGDLLLRSAPSPAAAGGLFLRLAPSPAAAGLLLRPAPSQAAAGALLLRSAPSTAAAGLLLRSSPSPAAAGGALRSAPSPAAAGGALLRSAPSPAAAGGALLRPAGGLLLRRGMYTSKYHHLDDIVLQEMKNTAKELDGLDIEKVQMEVDLQRRAVCLGWESLAIKESGSGMVDTRNFRMFMKSAVSSIRLEESDAAWISPLCVPVITTVLMVLKELYEQKKNKEDEKRSFLQLIKEVLFPPKEKEPKENE